MWYDNLASSNQTGDGARVRSGSRRRGSRKCLRNISSGACHVNFNFGVRLATCRTRSTHIYTSRRRTFKLSLIPALKRRWVGAMAACCLWLSIWQTVCSPPPPPVTVIYGLERIMWRLSSEHSCPLLILIAVMQNWDWPHSSAKICVISFWCVTRSPLVRAILWLVACAPWSKIWVGGVCLFFGDNEKMRWVALLFSVATSYY